MKDQKKIDCCHYDAEFDCCKWFSDWSDPMPVLQPCIESPCKYYERRGGWISVDERLPTYKDGKVLIYTAYGISIAQKTTTNHWKGDNAIPKQITHWMPLPEPPKGE